MLVISFQKSIFIVELCFLVIINIHANENMAKWKYKFRTKSNTVKEALYKSNGLERYSKGDPEMIIFPKDYNRHRPQPTLEDKHGFSKDANINNHNYGLDAEWPFTIPKYETKVIVKNLLTQINTQKFVQNVEGLFGFHNNEDTKYQSFFLLPLIRPKNKCPPGTVRTHTGNCRRIVIIRRG